METVFEVNDTSNEETYYPMGIFLTLEEAKAEVITLAESDGNVTDYGCDDGHEQLSIIERKIGWSGSGKTVFTINRENKYSEDLDTDNWVITARSDEGKG